MIVVIYISILNNNKIKIIRIKTTMNKYVQYECTCDNNNNTKNNYKNNNNSSKIHIHDRSIIL